MLDFDPHGYGPALASLVDINRRRSLGAGEPDRRARSELTLLSIETTFVHGQIADQDMAWCCIAGVWLLHDFLGESHTISQGIETRSGSFWHAIMHRREGDFANAKYWLRRVGQHPAFDRIEQHTGGKYDPLPFVDRCEAVIHGERGDRDACLDIQQAEWEVLFDYCYNAAIGG